MTSVVSNSRAARKWFKRTVRMFKYAKARLIRDGKITSSLAPSYFVECLLSNVPNGVFGDNHQRSFFDVLVWLQSDYENFHKYLAQNQQDKLFGDERWQWDEHDAKRFLTQVRQLWREWE